MTTITHKDILSHDAKRVAMFFRAYKECSDEVRLIIDEMMEIISSDDAEEDEREQAIDVVLEALFPGLNAEMIDLDEMVNSSEKSAKVRSELDREEETFAAKLKELMDEKGMTQEKLAGLTGVSQPAIANMLNRHSRPQSRTVARFAEVFEIDPEELWPSK